MGKLRLISWNADGVAARKYELAQLLRDMDVDVALLQETHLRPTDSLNVPFYQTYRTDRRHQDRASGGTAILVHRRVTHRPLPVMPAADIEVTRIAVHYDGEELEVSSIYNPPNRLLQPRLLDLLLRPGCPTLAAGDLNSKHLDWGCHSTNAPGKGLKAYLTAHDHVHVLAPEEPSHYPYNGLHQPDILDIGLAGSLERQVEVFAVSDLSSDHVPVVFDLPDDGVLTLPPGRTPRVNWRRYANYLADRPRPPPPPAETPDQLDQQVLELTATLQDAVTASSSPPSRKDIAPPLPQELRDEVRLRRRLRREYQRTRCPHAKTIFNRQARRVSLLLADHRAAAWEDYIERQAADPGGIWKVARALRGEKRTVRPLHGQRGIVYSPADRAEAFADTMEDQFSPHADVYDDETCDMVEDFLESYTPDEDDPLPLVTTHEVRGHLRRLRPKKAPGPDSLGTPALKDLPGWVVIFITCVFNSCLRLAHFPTTWKDAKVIMIPKPGKDCLFPDNHRPISLLPVLSKIFERLVLARFPEEFFASIRTEQFGFRTGHSTTLQLRRVLNNITGVAERGHHSTSVLIDVSKAFDRVWHEGLLYKLAQSPLPGRMFRLIQSYLRLRTFSISVGQSTSTSRPVSSGVPQGSVLGPVLYLWYTNDIPVAPRIQLSLYADDALFTTSSANLRMARVYMQRQLDLLQPWLTKWRIKANADKCEAIAFTRSRRQADGRHLTLDGDNIPWKTTVKYLGVVLDSRLTLTPHVERVCGLAKAGLASISPLLRSTKLPTKTKILLYTALLRPVITYAAPAWYHLTCRTARRKLAAIQSKSLRRATRSPWFVRNAVVRASSGVPALRDFVDGLTAKLEETADSSPWEHIRLLGEEEVPQLRPPMPD